MYYVYSLSHPENYNVAYIGITDNLLTRYRMHISESGCTNEVLSAWIDYLLSCAMFPIMDVLDTTEDKQAAIEKEKEIIKEFSSNGILLNIKEYQSFNPQKAINKKYIRHKAVQYHIDI